MDMFHNFKQNSAIIIVPFPEDRYQVTDNF